MPLPMDSIKPFLLQWILAERVVLEQEALRLARDLMQEDEDIGIDTLFAGARETLLSYHMDLQRIILPDTNEYQWLFCNRLEDNISRLATVCSAEEIDCFKRLVCTV